MFASTAGAGGSIFSGNGIGEQQVGGGIRALGLGGGGLGLRDSMSFNSLNPGLVAFVPRTTMRMGGEIGFWNTTSNGLTDSDGEMTWKDLRLYVPLTSRWKFGAGLEPVFRQDLHTIGTRSANFPTDSADVQDYEERVTWTGSTADVRLDISNVLGQRVQSVGAGSQTAGMHSMLWNGRDERGDSVPSGTYFYRLITDGQPQASRKMVLVR